MSNPSGDSTISGLPLAQTLLGTEQFVVDQNQSGTLNTVRLPLSQLATQLFNGQNPLPPSGGGTGRTTLTAHAVLVGEGTSAVGQIGPGATGQMLIGVTGADPVWGSNPTITGGTIDGATVGGTTPAAGAFTTVSATTPVGVASGGTGRATLTNHGVLVGAGTSSVTQLAVGTTGQMLIGVTGADPAFGNTVSTLTATGAITPSSTNGIVGTTTNDNANAGSVGEFISSNVPVGSAVALTSPNAANVTSISLTAGDWDVWGNIATNPAGSTTQSLTAGAISTVSATMPTIPNGGAYAQMPFAANTGNSVVLPIGATRLSLSATTTVYLVAQSIFAASTNAAYGFIGARRRR